MNLIYGIRLYGKVDNTWYVIGKHKFDPDKKVVIIGVVNQWDNYGWLRNSGLPFSLLKKLKLQGSLDI